MTASPIQFVERTNIFLMFCESKAFILRFQQHPLAIFNFDHDEGIRPQSIVILGG